MKYRYFAVDQDTSEDETLAGDGGGDSSQKKKGKGTTSAAVKSEASESVFDAEYHKPSELANKQSKKKAMTDLLNKRREKKQGSSGDFLGLQLIHPKFSGGKEEKGGPEGGPGLRRNLWQRRQGGRQVDEQHLLLHQLVAFLQPRM